MSYCVNCGVQLEENLKRCPLCDTEVINPNLRREPDPAAIPYPSKVERLEKVATRRFLVLMATIMLLIPPVICFLCDILYSGRITWSGYVIGATAMAYIYVLLPFALGRPNPWFCLGLDCAVTLLYFFAIAQHLKGAWFLPLALPITLAAAAAAAVVILLLRRCKAKSLIAAGLLLTAGMLCVVIDMIINLYLGKLMLHWSLFVLAPCILLALAALVLNRRARFKEEVKRRFFI